MSPNVLTKDKTLIIKGFAILFMIVHHCLIKEFYLKPPEILSTTLSIRLMSGSKICVGIYTFFVGYGCFYAKNIDFKYIFSRIWRLLKQYWIVLFLTISILFAHYICVDNLGAFIRNYESKVLLLNLIGLNPYYNLGNWYVYFYIYSLCIMPIVTRILRTNVYIKALIITLVCGLSSYYITYDSSILLRALSECLRYTPILIVGYLSAKMNLCGIINEGGRLCNKPLFLGMTAILVFALRCCVSSIKGIMSDVVLVPIFVIAICILFTGREDSFIAKLLTTLGVNSTLMWFVHALPFSTITRNIFQNSIFWPDNVLTILVNVIFSSYIVSVVLKLVLSKLRVVKRND